MRLRPMFSFYGSKWSAAPRYPKPKYGTIIEPFAGSACYSLCYPEREVILVEKDHIIASIWKWLISATPSEILQIPCTFDSVDDIKGPQELRWFMGFWVGSAAASPKKKTTPWCQWSKRKRDRVASQVEHIRHWRVICGDYTESPDIEATWFIDPPYCKQGKHYRCGSEEIDYNALATWCMDRKGQVMVCESEGATWLPFQPFTHISVGEYICNGRRRGIKEALWTRCRSARGVVSA